VFSNGTNEQQDQQSTEMRRPLLTEYGTAIITFYDFDEEVC